MREKNSTKLHKIIWCLFSCVPKLTNVFFFFLAYWATKQPVAKIVCVCVNHVRASIHTCASNWDFSFNFFFFRLESFKIQPRWKKNWDLFCACKYQNFDLKSKCEVNSNKGSQFDCVFVAYLHRFFWPTKSNQALAYVSIV